MTPEEIVDHVEIDMKEGGAQYQPAYWKSKLLVRLKAHLELAKEEGRKAPKEPAKENAHG